MNEPLRGCPAPLPGGLEGDEAKAAHFTWNLRVNVAVELFWGLAISLSSTSTIVPIFLADSGASARLIALVPGVSLVGFALLQLPSAYFTTRMARKAGPVIWAHVPMLLSWLGAAFIARDLAADRPDLARGLLLACLGVASVTGGVGLPMWADFLNRQTPARTRGRFFGWAFAAGSVTGLAGGFLARALIGRLGFPQGFAWCFYIAAAAMLVGLLPYMLVRETVVRPIRFPSVGAFARHVLEVLHRRRNLRRLVLVRCLMEAGMMGAAFYAVRALAVAGFSDSAAGTFTIIATAAQAPAMLLAGYLGERFGFRLVMTAGGAWGAAATAIALLGGSPYWFYLLFVCSGCTFACDIVSTMNLVIELSPEHDKTVYQALYSTLLVPVRIAYPLLAGWVGEAYGMGAIFRLALPLQVLGVVAVLTAIKDAKGRHGSWDEGMPLPPSPALEDLR